VKGAYDEPAAIAPQATVGRDAAYQRSRSVLADAARDRARAVPLGTHDSGLGGADRDLRRGPRAGPRIAGGHMLYGIRARELVRLSGRASPCSR